MSYLATSRRRSILDFRLPIRGRGGWQPETFSRASTACLQAVLWRLDCKRHFVAHRFQAA
ncbi:hypothetical protein [Kingella sp. (in: b-proteobacteria)]|uniref:hypothetical protein n=1 Tax=Kingella sp. (in: b-proteobacteria) TaxID=2020713 RepID=UPI0026DD73EE|nr:hypothetical protein [Kingella sp. (in: b-proteobacteria)]MDO4658610.1 hypothetical protein [Kingella sp. (in: b-proteobacteria)]